MGKKKRKTSSQSAQQKPINPTLKGLKGTSTKNIPVEIIPQGRNSNKEASPILLSSTERNSKGEIMRKAE